MQNLIILTSKIRHGRIRIFRFKFLDLIRKLNLLDKGLFPVIEWFREDLGWKVLGISLCLLQPFFSYSAFEEVDLSARAVGMGGAYTGLSDEGTGLFYNPSGLTQLRSGEITFFTSQLFGLKEFTYLVFAYGQPTPYGSAGLGFSQFGEKSYREQVLVLSYSNQWKNLLIGGSLKGMNLSIEEFGSDHALGMDMGLLWRLKEDLNLGAVGKNINGPALGNGEGLPQSIQFGLSFHPEREILLNLDLNQEMIQGSRLPIQFRLGQEYLVSDFFALRAGWVTSPQTLTGGVGFGLHGIHLDYGVRSHPELGLTHSLALSYGLKQNNR